MKYFNRSFAGTLAKLFFDRELEFILRTVTDDAC